MYREAHMVPLSRQTIDPIVWGLIEMLTCEEVALLTCEELGRVGVFFFAGSVQSVPWC